MINIKILFDDIYMVMMKKQTFFEIILHLSFVLIIFLLITIFYWDTINRKVINTSRCKVSLDNSDSLFNVRFFDKNTNTSVLNISYDNTPKHNYRVECVCPAGNELNDFKEIPVFNNDNKKVEKITKNCYCDQNYKNSIMDDANTELSQENMIIDGDSFLVDYYQNLFTDISQMNLGWKTKQLSFPS